MKVAYYSFLSALMCGACLAQIIKGDYAWAVMSLPPAIFFSTMWIKLKLNKRGY